MPHRASTPPEPFGPSRSRLIVKHHRISGIARSDVDLLFGRFGDVMVSSAGSWATGDWARRRDGFEDWCAYEVLDGTQTVAFSTYRFVEINRRPAVHVSATYVLPSVRSSGIALSLMSRIVFRELRRRTRSGHYWVSDALNPVVLDGWRRRVPERALYPQARGEPGEAGPLSDVAAEAASLLYPEVDFDRETGVLHSKTQPRPIRHPESGDVLLDRYFERWVAAERGDTLLVLVDGSWSTLTASFRRLIGAVPSALAKPGRRIHEG